MLTYVGHWPRIAFDVPFTNGYWELPFVSETHVHEGDVHAEEEHEQHCHANVSKCLNGTTSAIGFASLLLAAVAMLGRNGSLRRVRLDGHALYSGMVFWPESPPPRA